MSIRERCAVGGFSRSDSWSGSPWLSAWIVPHRAQATPVLGATAIGLVGQGQYGTIKGRLVWGGDQLPPVKVLAEKGKAANDPEVYALNQPILSRELAVDPATKGLPYGFAYLSRPTGRNPEAVQDLIAKHPKAELDQQNCEFLPYVLPIHQDQTLVVKSSDPTNHNVRLAPFRNPPINHTLSGSRSNSWPKPCPIKVDCDIHSWTHGWVMVFDHTFFGVTGNDGTFEIRGGPGGQPEPRVVAGECGVRDSRCHQEGMTVEVKPGEVTDVAISSSTPRRSSRSASLNHGALITLSTHNNNGLARGGTGELEVILASHRHRGPAMHQAIRPPRFRVRSLMLAVGVVALLIWGGLMGARWVIYYRRARFYGL